MKESGFKKTIDWYNSNAKTYANSISDKIPQYQIDEFVDAVGVDGYIPDAGCGGGRDSNLLSQKRLKTVGLDISEGLLAEARKNFPNLDFRLQSFINSDFKDAEFDGIWANLCLVHFENLEDTKNSFKEFNRVLKPSGYLHLVVKERVNRGETEVVTDAMTNHPRFFRFYTKDEINNYLTENNFEIIKNNKYQETDYYPNGRKGEYFLRILAKKI